VQHRQSNPRDVGPARRAPAPATDSTTTLEAGEANSAWSDALFDATTGSANRMKLLIEGAAKALGADADQARQIARECAMLMNRLPVMFAPASAGMGCTESLMAFLNTCVPIGSQGAEASKVLLQAAGLLAAFNVGLSASPDACWVIHRLVHLDGLTPTLLADHLKAMRSIAEVLWPGVSP
jgi:hypothetical protein